MREFMLVIMYFVLAASVFCIFNARVMIIKKVKEENRNKVVNVIKIISTIIVIITLAFIVYIRR